jgi:major membrane immunogen (membrane-anchored lipoprotein)
VNIQSPAKTLRIRQLNDTFRRTFFGGVVVLTNSVNCLDQERKSLLLKKVQDFEAFDEGNDPHAEHDFLSVDVDGEKYYAKIDYYDRSMEMGSEDPADPAKTKRVMTVMHSADY